jgi:hypothetical protein
MTADYPSYRLNPAGVGSHRAGLVIVDPATVAMTTFLHDQASY